MEETQGRESVSDNRTPNPAKFFASWSSKDKQFSFYDKTNKVDVLLPMPFAFIPIFTMVTLKGYNHAKKLSYWSNEVKDLRTDSFTIMVKNNMTKQVQVYMKGLYSEIRDRMDDKINYTTSLYVGVKDKQGVLQLANLQIATSSLKPWIEFAKKVDVSKIAVQVATFTNETNGSVSFTAPVYSPLPVTPKVDAEAGALQRQVKEYIAKYLAEQASMNQNNSTAAQAPETTFNSPEPTNDFGAPAPSVAANTQDFAANYKVEAPQANGGFGGEQVNSNAFDNDDVPF